MYTIFELVRICAFQINVSLLDKDATSVSLFIEKKISRISNTQENRLSTGTSQQALECQDSSYQKSRNNRVLNLALENVSYRLAITDEF